ncbi:hypothetical protein F3J34_30380 [Klebsiella sp. Ap-873]|nr:hypothetical protein [Klebsiella sp. Ap-873]
MESKSREQFDQYLKSQQLKPVGWIRDEYWKIWKASRAALVVELKQFDEFQICPYGANEEYAKGYIDAQNNAKKAIRAAGITVKGEGDGKR